MGNLLSLLTIANPIITGSLTILFFLETQRSKKRAEDLNYLLKEKKDVLPLKNYPKRYPYLNLER